MAEQRARLAVDAQLAQQMAAGVIGEHAVEVRADVFDAQHIDQKLGQLEGGRAQKLGAGAIGRVILPKQQAVEVAGHRRATAARRHDGIDLSAAHQRLEDVDEAPRQHGRASSRSRR
jgi:hypothetical protein